jgi:hypothetical protein
VLINEFVRVNFSKLTMVVVVLGLRTAGQTSSTLTSSLERLCSKEERTWKERVFNQMRLVSGNFSFSRCEASDGGRRKTCCCCFLITSSPSCSRYSRRLFYIRNITAHLVDRRDDGEKAVITPLEPVRETNIPIDKNS